MTRTQSDRELDWATGRELERKDAEITRLVATLDLIADIAEGSQTLNSLPNIAKIARARQPNSIG